MIFQYHLFFLTLDICIVIAVISSFLFLENVGFSTKYKRSVFLVFAVNIIFLIVFFVFDFSTSHSYYFLFYLLLFFVFSCIILLSLFFVFMLYFAKTNNVIVNIKSENEFLLGKSEKTKKITVLKRDFLANMSHELRTPLHGILGVSIMLIETNLNKEQKKYLTALRTAGYHALMTINEILDFSKLEVHKLELEKLSFSVLKSLEKVFEMISPIAKDHKIEMIYKIEKNVPVYVLGDVMRVEQVLSHLLKWVLKFSKKSSSLCLLISAKSLQNKQKMLYFRVFPDLPLRATPRSSARSLPLFDPSLRLSLNVMEKLSVLMGGAWDFCFTEGSFSILVDEIEPHLETVVMQNTFNLRILVAEDNMVNQKILEHMLQKLGYTCEFVGSGKDVLEALKCRKYDLIFMDLQMPGMDGLETVKQMKIKYPGKEQIPAVVIMTAQAKEDAETQVCFAEGVDGYIAKPINMEELQKILVKISPSV